MPRRKRTFIQRSKARTFQLVHQPTSSDPNHHLLVPQAADAAADAIDAANLSQAYDPHQFDLGEYGFPDDGYNYAKHFRTIGGGGGVFIDGASGLPDPSAVDIPRSEQPPSRKKPTAGVGDVVRLREEHPADASDVDHSEPLHWKQAEDMTLRQNAIDAIRRDRVHDVDVDDIFAALDSDGDLDSDSFDDDPPTQSSRAQSVRDCEEDEGQATGDDGDALLEDDFIAIASVELVSSDPTKEKESKFTPSPDGIREKYREPRVLDAQFDEFMRGFEEDEGSSDDEDEQALRRMALQEDQHGADAKNVMALMSKEEREAFGASLDADELLDGLSGLALEEVDEGDGGDVDSSALGGGPSTKKDEEDVGAYIAEEFERGLKGVLDSYTRVSATEVLEKEDADVGGLQRAVARQEEEERERMRRKEEAGEESEGHDSELETLFDEMFKETERWDCETILSTYTNVDNHPSVIDAPSSRGGASWREGRRKDTLPVIRLDPRTQAPAEFVPEEGGRAGTELVDYGSRRAAANGVMARERGESKAEKKARKAAVKEAARERRALKSDMKKAFGAENAKQEKHSTSLGSAKVVMRL